MTRMAYVFAPAEPTAAWRWCVLRANGEYTTGQGLETLTGDGANDTDAERRPDAITVVLVVPGEEVLAARIAVPTRSRRQINAALPYLVEEFLAEDVDQMHLASGERADDGTVPVRVLRPERLRGWLEALAVAGLEVASAYVDHDALDDDGTAEADRVEVWIGAQRALVRGWRSAFAVERGELTSLLGAVLAERTAATGLRFRIGASVDADVELLLAELVPFLGSENGVSVEQRELGWDLETSVAKALETGRPGAAPPELLTGAFRPLRQRDPQTGRWRFTAGLLIGWLLVEGGIDAGRTAWLMARTETLRAENLAFFQEIVPGRTRSPDPRRELETLLGDRSESGTSFLALLGVVASETRELGSGIKVRSLNWNTERGDLSVDLSMPGITQVDRFKERLEADGYPVTIDSAVQEQSRVRARLRVRDEGAS